MTGIWEFPEIEELAEELESYFKTNKELARTPDNRTNNLSLTRMLVIEEWGKGTATVGEDPLLVIFFANIRTIGDIPPSQDPTFTENAGAVQNSMEDNLNRFDPPEGTFDWFPDAELIVGPADAYEDTINRRIGDRTGNTLFELTTLEVIELGEEQEEPLTGGTGIREFREINRIDYREYLEEEEEEEEEEEDDFIQAFRRLRPALDVVTTEVEPPLQEREIEIIEFPEVHENLRSFARSEDELSIPAGPEEKKVEARDPYDFEHRMALTTNELNDIEGLGPADQITFGVPIGFSVQTNRLGTELPPANFPRTSSYIMNRLNYEGLTYILDLYRDLVIYSGYISDFYGMTLKAGSYQAFREFIWRLREIPERGGPELIEDVSQQKAASMGLETIPDHPSIEGEKAPWLDNRSFIQINEDNFRHEAWLNPTEYLYEEV